MGFFMKEDAKEVRIDENTYRTILAHDGKMLMARIRFSQPAKEEELALHSHPHEQSTYVLKGRLQFFIREEFHIVTPGDTLYFPPGVPHGCVPLEPDCQLIDIFTPQREDFL